MITKSRDFILGELKWKFSFHLFYCIYSFISIYNLLINMKESFELKKRLISNSF